MMTRLKGRNFPNKVMFAEIILSAIVVKILQYELAQKVSSQLHLDLLKFGFADLTACYITTLSIAARDLKVEIDGFTAIWQIVLITRIFKHIFKRSGSGKIERGLKKITPLTAASFLFSAGKVGMLLGGTNGALSSIALSTTALIRTCSYLGSHS